MHDLVLHLPILTTVLAAAFAAILFRRHHLKGGGLHLLWWGIGMVTYGVGTLTESYTTLFGWDPSVFRLWYVAGAFLGGYPLAQGSIYLLFSKRFADWSARIVTTIIAVGTILVFLSPLNVAAAEAHRLSGRPLGWQWLRAISPFLNLYSLIFLAGGAAMSAVRYRRDPAERNRYAGNILIAIGAVLPGIGGMMTRLGHVEVLYVTELIGLLLIFNGYRRCVSSATYASFASQMPATAAALLCILLLPDSLRAEETAEEKKARASFFADVTVTATGSERSVFDVATPVTVIRQDKITRKLADNAADLLREEPGVDVNGVGPNQARPIIRGQRGLRVLFLENGLRLNNPRRQTDFGEIGGLVDLQSVASIEVVRGPASVLYGSDAIGGVLNMVTREPAFRKDSNFSGFIDGRHSTAGDLSSLSAGINTRTGRFTLQLGGTKRNADEYDAPAGRFGEIRLSDDTTVFDTGVEDTSVWGSVAFAPSDGNTVRLRLNRYRAGETGFGYVPAETFGATEAAKIRILYPQQSFDRYTLSYNGSALRQVWADSTNLQVYYQSNERDLVNDIDIDIGPVGPGLTHSTVHADTQNFTDLDTRGFRADAVKVLSDGHHILTYGAEGTRDDSFNTDASVTRIIIRTPRGEFPSETTDNIANAPNATNTSWGVFAQDEMVIGNRLGVTGGLRVHSVKTVAESTPGWNVSGLDFSDRNIAGALTARYQVAPSTNVFASYGRGFRAPNVIERLFNGPTPEGSGFQILNAELESETSDNIDLGVKVSRANAFLEATVFRNEIHGGIIQAFLSPAEIAQLDATTRAAITAAHPQFVVQQRNTARLRDQGTELALGWRSRSGLVLGGNATWIDGERIDSTNPPTGDTYARKLFAYARFQPESSRYWVEYHVRNNGSHRANLDPNAPVPAVGRILPGFTVHGVGAGARLFQTGAFAHDVTAWVENATNELYAEFSNATFFRPEPGRTAKVSYRLTF